MENYEESLSKILAEKYPDECVELGENWELIAKIFYELGYADAIEEGAIEEEKIASYPWNTN